MGKEKPTQQMGGAQLPPLPLYPIFYHYVKGHLGYGELSQVSGREFLGVLLQFVLLTLEQESWYNEFEIENRPTDKENTR